MTGMQTADRVEMGMGREVLRLPHLKDEGKVGGKEGGWSWEGAIGKRRCYVSEEESGRKRNKERN